MILHEFSTGGMAMKKHFFIGLIITILISFNACGTSEHSSKNTYAENLKALEKHAITPAENFEFIPDEINPDGLALYAYHGTEEIVVIPNEVNGKKIVSIVNQAFGAGSGVKAVRISDSVERISTGFRDNEELQYVIFGSGLKEIWEYSFWGCHSLERVELNEGLIRIEYNAFANMDSLSYIYVPGTVTEIISAAIHIEPENFVMAGKAGSAAEDFAKLLRYTFEVVE